MARGALDLWNHWSIQILVLLSLGLQLFLFAFVGIRRRGANTVLRFMLWLAYLLADSTAISALSHISLSGTTTREHRLVSFWAPFLLLHLGGPDNLTAYALQDNQLWVRHLQIFLVQVLGAAYVLYKQIAANGFLVLVATALMFAVGVVKYAERIWALRYGKLSSIRCSIKKERLTSHGHLHPHDNVEAAGKMVEESILRRAHSLFHICKRAIVDSSKEDGWYYHDTMERLGPDRPFIWDLMEMELSLMYDILYTKAAVIHTWFGYSVRLFSPLATVASLMLFHFSREDGHRGFNVIITYALLGGALLMETTSLVNALGSTWAFAFLCTTRWSWLKYQALCSARWDRLRRAVASLHHLVKAASSSYRSRRWSGTIGQYNMLHFCTRPDGPWTTPLFGRLLKMVGFSEWYDRKHYSGSVEITEPVKEHALYHMIQLYKKDKVNKLGVLRSKWGKEALDRHKSSLEDQDYDKLELSLGDEFHEGVIMWHIATDVFLANSKQAREEGASARVEAIKLLSNYMMFLLVLHPDMLPGLAQNRLYQQTCKNLIMLWSSTPSSQSIDIGKMLQSLFRLHDNPSSSRATERKDLANILFTRKLSPEIHAYRLIYATKVARLLVEEVEVTTDAVQLVLDVWTDFAVYAGNKGSRESHAKKLSSGIELATILWLMAEHLYQVSLELIMAERRSRASLKNV